MKRIFFIAMIIVGLVACKATTSSSSSSSQSNVDETTTTSETVEKSNVNPVLQVSPGNKTMSAPKKTNAVK